MNAARVFVGLLGTHTLVGTVAWLNGWLVGRLLERRRQELDWRRPVLARIVDLTDPPAPYDWQRDGEAVGARP